MRSFIVVSLSAAAVFSGALAARGQDNRVLPVSRMDSAQALAVEEGEVKFVREGPRKNSVARFDDDFSLRVDMAALRAKPGEFDLLKLEVKSDAHAFLVVSLENFPRPGELSHWYVLDGTRPALPWKTIWIDLNKPEEIKAAGTYKGMAADDPAARGLRLRGRIEELRRSRQEPGRTIWLGDVKFVKKTVDLDWDQSQAPFTWEKGKDLIFRYPLSVTNKTSGPVTALLAVTPAGTKHAKATLSQTKIALKPRETKAVEATISLPAAVAAQAAPLYCERFEALATVEGLADSDVTILRSSDVIPLSVTVPIAEDKLGFPLLPRIKTIPPRVTAFGPQKQPEAAKIASEVSPEDLVTALNGPLPAFGTSFGFNYSRGKVPFVKAGDQFKVGLTACAFQYDLTGERQYLDRGVQLLVKAAELFPPRVAEWRAVPYSPISHGIFAPNTVNLGWTTGSMRWPYSYDRHGCFNDFDLLAKDIEPAKRELIIRDFLVPAAIQMRNHYFGLSNQQDVVNYPVMYAGMAARNWPLVSHAYDSTHGLLRQIEFAFDDEGMAAEGNYHKPSIEPVLCATELLLAHGIDLYDQRLYSILHSRAAAIIGKSYDSPTLAWADENRFAGKPSIRPYAASDGMHLATGVTLLRWKRQEVSMNWGAQQNRSAPDRCSLRIGTLGGGNYTPSSLGQSIIIVDEGRQNPEPAQVLGYDVDGPVQFVAAASDQHFPGSRITRLFALLGDGVLVLDRVTSDRPRTVDWCLKEAGGKVELPMSESPGGFTKKPDDRSGNLIFGNKLKGDRHFSAVTDQAWTEGKGRLMMAAEQGTRVLTFNVPPTYSAVKALPNGVPVLIAHRADVKQTDFVTFFSTRTKSVERVPVQNADGSEADALGARVVLKDGKVVQALVNYRPGTPVHLGKLATSELFATDFVE